MTAWQRRSEPRLRAALPQGSGLNGILINEPSRRNDLRGKAVGGPCDGARVEAHAQWDGVVKYKIKGEGFERDHPGRYRWDGSRWFWHEGERPPQKIF